MFNSGIIRRIDDLGRIVIPKEIRRNLNLHEGDPMELWVDGDKIVCKKYVPDIVSVCEAEIQKHKKLILSVSFSNGVTHVILKDGRVGNAVYNPNDSFNMNVAIVYALKNAGVGIEALDG